MPSSFSKRLLIWYDHAGRKDLPWQLDKTPYRVWVSEVMLQQTQVQTVIPYFERFVRKFPTLSVLAAASIDEVVKYWAGLGYYARARNLHLAARQICEQFDGKVPQKYEDLIALSGIGRSTAGAILALCFNQPFPILDSNVKRVLTRHKNIEGWPGKADVSQQLWALSATLLPRENIADYTQAMMDLGAMVCTRIRPHCNDCPVSLDCEAYIKKCIADRPSTLPKRKKPMRSAAMLIITHDDKVLLQRRPSTGIWSGLLCLPEIRQANDAATWCQRQFGIETDALRWDKMTHEFTHFKLNIYPVVIHLRRLPHQIMESDNFVWCKIRHAKNAGVPAPIKKLLTQLVAIQSMEK